MYDTNLNFIGLVLYCQRSFFLSKAAWKLAYINNRHYANQG